MKLVKFEYEENYIDEFINLTKKLYTKDKNMEDESNIKSFLTDNHYLSKYFKLNKYLVYKKDEVVGRFIITEYPDDNDVCYIGFFECINDKSVSKFIFDNTYEFAKEKKYKKIIGPVDASFWNKYRLKINMFDKLPYTGEPYNLDYYYDMFLENKYKVCSHYVSNMFDRVDESYEDKKFTEHYEEFKKMGYIIKKPELSEFDKCIEEVYDLIMVLYSDFPVFKKIEKEDFIKQFSSYKKIINMDMVRMAYYKDKAVGFLISIPNYNNKVYHLNLLNIISVLWTKKHPKEYVMPYLGVDQNHRGLGKAIAFSVLQELKKSNLPSINALIKDNNVNLKYGSDKILNQYEYVLLERIIK